MSTTSNTNLLSFVNSYLSPEHQITVDSLKSYATALLLNILTYPLELATFLFQLGYVPPTTENLVVYSPNGEKLYKVPGVLEYIRDLYKHIGLYNMTHGLFVKLLRNFIYTASSQKMSDMAPHILADVIQHQPTPNLSWEGFKECIATSTLKHTTAVFLSHPFHVLSNLQAAQIIGNEDIYNGCFLSAFSVITEKNGFEGLWASLTPRLWATVLSFVLSDLFEWFIRAKYVTGEGVRSPMTLEGQVLQLGKSIGMVLGQVMTPTFPALSSIMVVRGSGLKAGDPPYSVNCYNFIRCRYLVIKKKFVYRKLGIVSDYTPYPIIVLP